MAMGSCNSHGEPSFIGDHPYGGDEVRVVGDHYCDIEVAFPRIIQEVDSKVYIGAFLFHVENFSFNGVALGVSALAFAFPGYRIIPDFEGLGL